MSRATRQRDAVAPSLFPFLAVLLCTMGALVLLLMLIVSGAQASALQVAKESEQQVEEVESQIEVARGSLKKQLEEGRIELEKKRLALQHLENHIQEIVAELEKLKRTAELAEDQAATDDAAAEARTTEISELEAQLLEANEKLKQKLEKPDGDKPIFAIIPYDGPNGTYRRPIYLECVQDGLRIQPEGVLIRIADLEPPYGPGNPLDAALRTIRAHYVPANHAVTSTAYPLLVVRPSGIRSYAMARAAMSGWDDQFGYELVGEDLELVFPEGEPGLAQKITQSLDLARGRQAALIMAMPHKYREFAERDGRLSGGAAAAADPLPSADGYGGGASGDGGGWNGNGPSAGSSSRGGWADGSAAAAGGGPQLTESLPGSSGAATGGLLGFGGAATNPTLDFDAARNSAAASASGDLAANQLGPAGGAGDRLFGSAGGGNAADATAAFSNSGQGSSGPWQEATSAGSQPSSSGQSVSGQSVSGQAVSGRQAGGVDGQAGGSSASGSSSGSSGSSGSAAAGSSGGQANVSGSPMELPQISLNQSFGSQRTAAESTTAVAARKGRGWAWSQGPPSQTSVVRTIRMQCLVDRWIVLPDSAKNVAEAVTIPFDDTPQERAEQLAKVVADRVDLWGIALSGGYWKPVLQVDVAPDAEWRFHQLQQLLSGSGLEIQRAAPPAK